MPKLYQKISPQGIENRGGLVDFLKPAGTGAVDVLDSYVWTLSRQGENDRDEIPAIRLKEYRIIRSSLETASKYYIEGVSSAVTGDKDPTIGYKGLFDYNTPSGFEYTFPFFSEINSEVQSSWTTLDVLEKAKNALNIVSEGLGDFSQTVAEVGKFARGTEYPRVGIMDRPKMWEQSTPRSINIRFPLFNTKDFDNIQDNWELCYLLMYQNLFNKRDFITALPPVFYVVYAPGQYYSPGAYVSDLKIHNKGNIHRMSIDGKVRNIPDAFEVDMTLTDMVMPSQNMQAVVGDDEPVRVTKILF